MPAICRYWQKDDFVVWERASGAWTNSKCVSCQKYSDYCILITHYKLWNRITRAGWRSKFETLTQFSVLEANYFSENHLSLVISLTVLARRTISAGVLFNPQPNFYVRIDSKYHLSDKVPSSPFLYLTSNDCRWVAAAREKEWDLDKCRRRPSPPCADILPEALAILGV